MKSERAQGRLNQIQVIMDRLKTDSGSHLARYIGFRQLLSLLEAPKLKSYPPHSQLVSEALAYVESPIGVQKFRESYRLSRQSTKHGSLGGPPGRLGGGRIFLGGHVTPINGLAARIGGFPRKSRF